MVNDIYNFLTLSDRIATGGQPTEAQLAAVAAEGYQVVINLALHDGEYSLPDEQATVEGLGMRYIHLPVIWQDPRPENFQDFSAAMQAIQDKKVFVHCAANMRVSAFMALYRILHQGVAPELAFLDMQRIWTPEGVWKSFMERCLNDANLASQV